MLDYVALGILIFAGITLFYGIIVIHDIPYEIAVHRNHPHQDAIHYAGWVSLFTLHAIWPFLWIWSTLYREDRGWGFDPDKQAPETEDITEPTAPEPGYGEAAANAAGPDGISQESIAAMQQQLDAFDDRLMRIERAILTALEPGSNEGDRG